MKRFIETEVFISLSSLTSCEDYMEVKLREKKHININDYYYY